MERQRRRWRLVALGVSLGLHVGALLWLQSGTVPVREPRSPKLLELTGVVWIDAVTPSAPRATVTPTPGPLQAAPLRAPKTTGTGAVVKTPSPVPLRLPMDSPRAIDLTRVPGGLPFLPGGSGAGADAPRGRTLHPEDLPGSEELLADEQERVSARVGTWMTRDLAAARVQGGLPDPSYGQLGADLRAATDEVPKFIDTDSPKAVGGALLESWGAGAERYGKTGAPYAEPEGRLENVERPSALSDAAAKGSPDAIATANFLAAGARLQEFADGRAGLALYALVEIRQQPSGALERVTLIRPSGLTPFDRWVTERAQHVGLGFSFDGGAGTHALRSVWRFDGILLYRRKVKASEINGRAALGMITMAALSALSSLGNTAPPVPGEPPRPLGPRMPALSGRFDELTGEMDVVDLTNPTYDCRVTLLEAD